MGHRPEEMKGGHVLASLGHVCALKRAGCKEREDVLQPVAPARLIAGPETLDLRVMGSPHVGHIILKGPD